MAKIAPGEYFFPAEMDQVTPSTLALTIMVDYIHVSCFHRYDPKTNPGACDATDVGTDGEKVTEACCACGGGGNGGGVFTALTNPTGNCVDYKDWKGKDGKVCSS